MIPLTSDATAVPGAGSRSRARSRAALRPVAAVFALAAVLLFWNLGGHDLWAPDEPYFAEGAREMVVDGEWLVPHVNGVVTTDKPPLFFWAIAAASLAAGEVTPWTARLPSALAALGTLLLVLRLALRMGGRTGEGTGEGAEEGTGTRNALGCLAWLAPLVLATTWMFWDKGRWSQIDALLCALIWVALSAFEAWRSGDADGRLAGLLFWGAAALAVLAKGPVGLLLPLGIALTCLLLDRFAGDRSPLEGSSRPRSWKTFAPLAGPLLFAALVGTWMVASSLGSADYSVLAALREHFVDRAVHGMHHRQPFWYYLTVLPVQLLPWTGLVPGALLLAWRRRDPADRFLLVAALFVVLFFSLSTEKRDLYLLPALPAFALLIARFVAAVGARSEAGDGWRSRPWLLGGQTALGLLLTLVGLALPVLGPSAAARGGVRIPAAIPWALGVVAAVTGLLTLWAIWRSAGGRSEGLGAAALRAVVVPAAGLALLYLLVVTWVYPALEGRKSARAFSETVAAATATHRAAGRPVLAHDLSNLPEAFAFYGDGLYTTIVDDPAALAAHLRQPEEAWAVVHAPVLEGLPAVLRERLEVVARDRLSRRAVALVHKP